VAGGEAEGVEAIAAEGVRAIGVLDEGEGGGEVFGGCVVAGEAVLDHAEGEEAAGPVELRFGGGVAFGFQSPFLGADEEVGQGLLVAVFGEEGFEGGGGGARRGERQEEGQGEGEGEAGKMSSWKKHLGSTTVFSRLSSVCIPVELPTVRVPGAVMNPVAVVLSVTS